MEIVELSSSIILLLGGIVAISALISSVTGMAGGIIMLSGMNFFIPMSPLIPIHGAIQLFNNSARTWLLKRHLIWSMCLPFSLGAILGAAAISVVLLTYSPSKSMPLILLAGLIAYTIFKPKKIPDIKIKNPHYFWVGIATGALGILAGAVDPLLGAFFYRDDLTKEEVVVNKSFMQLVTHLTKIPAFLVLGFSFIDHAFLIIVLSITAVVATKVGILMLDRIQQKLFRRLMWWALFFAFLRLIYKIFEMYV